MVLIVSTNFVFAHNWKKWAKTIKFILAQIIEFKHSWISNYCIFHTMTFTQKWHLVHALSQI